MHTIQYIHTYVQEQLCKEVNLKVKNLCDTAKFMKTNVIIIKIIAKIMF